MTKKITSSIDEVRQIKEDLARKAGYDVNKFAQLINKLTRSQPKSKSSARSGQLKTGTAG